MLALVAAVLWNLFAEPEPGCDFFDATFSLPVVFTAGVDTTTGVATVLVTTMGVATVFADDDSEAVPVVVVVVVVVVTIAGVMICGVNVPD